MPARVFGLVALVSVAFTGAAGEEFRLSQLSGTWVGRRVVHQVGECRTHIDKAAVVLTLEVNDEGDMWVAEHGAFLASGNVTAGTWEVELRNDDAFARCGEQERRYEKRYTGWFRRDGDDLRLEFEGEDAPCPPRCRFRDEYRVKKQDIE